jgi:hypothetical protein
MKKVIFYLSLAVLGSTQTFSQDLAGKRILNANTSVRFTNTNQQNTTGSTINSAKESYSLVSLNFGSGRISAKNTYRTLGFRLNFEGSQNVIAAQKRRDLSIGPQVSFGKFVKLLDKLYYSPSISLSAEGRLSTSTSSAIESNGWGLGAGITATPINFVYHFKENFLFTAGFGSAGFSYNYLHSKDETSKRNTHGVSLSGGLNNFSGIGVFYLFK